MYDSIILDYIYAMLYLDYGNIYYQALRDIKVGEELLVYYGDGYAACLGIDTTQLFEHLETVKKFISN